MMRLPAVTRDEIATLRAENRRLREHIEALLEQQNARGATRRFGEVIARLRGRETSRRPANYGSEP